MICNIKFYPIVIAYKSHVNHVPNKELQKQTGVYWVYIIQGEDLVACRFDIPALDILVTLSDELPFNGGEGTYDHIFTIQTVIADDSWLGPLVRVQKILMRQCLRALM